MKRSSLLALALVFAAPGRTAWAQAFPLQSLLSATGFLDQLAGPVITGMGLALDFRSYEPATPLGTKLGFDVGLASAALVQVTPGMNAALAQFTGSALPVPVLPNAAVLVLHKGLGERFDVGLTVLPPLPFLGSVGLSGIWWWGMSTKWAFWMPEEGPTLALRTSFTQAYLPFTSGSTTVTINPQVITQVLLMSRKLEYVDPYVGVGYQYAYGSLGLLIDNPAPVPDVSVPFSGNGAGFLALGGVSLRIPYIALRLTLEGSYSSAGANSLGTKVSFSF